ncbi:MAG: DUF433 domain-containing protein [Trueperaceae bacterium]
MQTSLEVPLTQDVKGRYVIRGTKLPLELILNAYKRGLSAEHIANQYNGLEIRDIYAVLAYYHDNRKELDEYLEEQNRISKEYSVDIEKNTAIMYEKIQAQLKQQQ